MGNIPAVIRIAEIKYCLKSRNIFIFTVPILHAIDHVLPWICVNGMVQNDKFIETKVGLAGDGPILAGNKPRFPLEKR